MTRPIIVIKVGGSLLDWPELPLRLSAYLEKRQVARPVLVVGGGRFADFLRNLDQTHAIGEARSHALALRVLDLTARVLEDLVPGLEVVDHLEDLPEVWTQGRVPILAPRRVLDEADQLPQTWSTTTDSIAARVADRLAATELVLLKSTPWPKAIEMDEAVKLGLVDPEFPRASAKLAMVTYHDLRGMTFKSIIRSGHEMGAESSPATHHESMMVTGRKDHRPS